MAQTGKPDAKAIPTKIGDAKRKVPAITAVQNAMLSIAPGASPRFLPCVASMPNAAMQLSAVSSRMNVALPHIFLGLTVVWVVVIRSKLALPHKLLLVTILTQSISVP